MTATEYESALEEPDRVVRVEAHAERDLMGSQCRRLLTPGSCDTCDYMRDDLLGDEDGEPYDIPDDPANPAS